MASPLRRNVAIIAHVDHGKTTLVDALLRDAGVFRTNQVQVECVLDSNPLERERGITVLAKNVAVHRGDLKVNIIDTPGHADFGGEVERVLRMADGVLLLVDAFDGPMPQTRYVLGKALAAGLHVIVVINKCDRPGARPHAVLDQVFALFLDLKATDKQLDFPVVYASGREGWTRREPGDADKDTAFLFDTIRDKVPPPRGDPSGPARLSVTTLDHNDFVGRIAIGRVDRGVLRDGMSLTACGGDRPPRTARLSGLFVFDDLGRTPAKEVSAGDIVAVQGFPDIEIGETLCDPLAVEPLPRTTIDEPTISMDFLVNDSPFAGREGQYVTSRQLRERLFREVETNVALRVEDGETADAFVVSGRGELHLAILVETMRREGYEFAVTRPEVIVRHGDHGREEPFERLYIEAPEPTTGFLIETLSGRRAQMTGMHSDHNGNVRIDFDVPTRGLIGFRDTFISGTGGEGIMNTEYLGYRPWAGEIQRHRNGALVASDTGKAVSFGIANAQERGMLFIEPGTDVYTGMIVGLHSRDNDLDVNVCKTKQLTNIRSSTSDIAVRLTPPSPPSLERSLSLIDPDEMVEVTPKSLRMRKTELNPTLRARETKRAKFAALGA